MPEGKRTGTTRGRYASKWSPGPVKAASTEGAAEREAGLAREAEGVQRGRRLHNGLNTHALALLPVQAKEVQVGKG